MTHAEIKGEPDIFGELVWYGADGNFYDANYPDTEGTLLNPDYDYLVEQHGFNPEYS